MTIPLRDATGRFITKTKTPVKVLSDQHKDSDYCLVLKTVGKNMASHHNPKFKYPMKGMVSDPYWKPTQVCGHGLHGFLWGEGDYSLAQWERSIWLVLKVLKKDIINIYNEKVKFPKGEVIYAGTIKGATDLICAHPEAADKRVMGCTRKVGDNEVAFGGYKSKLVGGKGCILKGDISSILTGGRHSVLKAGYQSKLTAGDNSVLKANAEGKLKGGHDCTLIAGNNSKLEAETDSILQAGYNSTMKAGTGSTLIFLDVNLNQHAFTVGKDGIKADTKYKWNDDKGELVVVP